MLKKDLPMSILSERCPTILVEYQPELNGEDMRNYALEQDYWRPSEQLYNRGQKGIGKRKPVSRAATFGGASWEQENWTCVYNPDMPASIMKIACFNWRSAFFLAGLIGLFVGCASERQYRTESQPSVYNRQATNASQVKPVRALQHNLLEPRLHRTGNVAFALGQSVAACARRAKVPRQSFCVKRRQNNFTGGIHAFFDVFSQRTEEVCVKSKLSARIDGEEFPHPLQMNRLSVGGQSHDLVFLAKFAEPNELARAV
jgi:hypothetical protein